MAMTACKVDLQLSFTLCTIDSMNQPIFISTYFLHVFDCRSIILAPCLKFWCASGVNFKQVRTTCCPHELVSSMRTRSQPSKVGIS